MGCYDLYILRMKINLLYFEGLDLRVFKKIIVFFFSFLLMCIDCKLDC